MRWSSHRTSEGIGCSRSRQGTGHVSDRWKVIVVQTDLFGAHEEQMFHCMRHARQIVRITEATDVDVHGCARLVCIRIVDQ